MAVIGQLSVPLGVIAAMVLAGSLLWLGVEVRGRYPRDPVTAPVGVEASWTRRHRTGLRRAGVGTLGGLLVLLATRWIAAGVGAGLLLALGPVLFGGGRAEKRSIATLEAVAEWIEALRDVSTTTALPQAIMDTAATAPALLQQPLSGLLDRMRTQLPLPLALRHLADDLDDPITDEVVGRLIAATHARGRQLQPTLTDLASTTRELVRVSRQVEASRRPLRMATVVALAATCSLFAGFTVAAPRFMAPYSAPTGQVVLCLVVALDAVGVGLLWWLAQARRPERFITARPRAAARSGVIPGGAV